MNASAIFKYFFRSFSYGIMLAVALLLLLPQLRSNNPLWDFFHQTDRETPPLSYAKALSLASPAVVNIYSADIQQTSYLSGEQRKQLTNLGSGVIMSSEGYILTNYHVVYNADLVEVFLQSGQRYAAELVGYDEVTDLAVLKVDGQNLPVIPQKPDMTSLVGDVVFAIGNPVNIGQTVTQGIISGTGRHGLSTTSYLEFLQTDAAINKGNSGGALVNTNGTLVGINSRIFTEIDQRSVQYGIQGISFAVPYQLANKIMQKIITHGRVIRGWLGISSRWSSNINGFVIDDVVPNSPADTSGLNVGDLVTKIDDVQITSIPHALDIIAETAPGTQLNFSVYRNKQLITIKVTIGEFLTR